MARRTRLSPRKTPKQARSVETVDALLAATAHILVKSGYAGLSTNGIAERAGVSIGSLYQFFPNKESILAALMQQHYDRIEQLVISRLEEVANEPPAYIARQLVHAVVAVHAAEPHLHRVLTQEIPHQTRGNRLRPIERRIGDALLRLFAHRRSELRCTNLPVAVHLVSVAVEALTHVLTDLPDGTTPEFWADEVTQLIVRYLLPLEHEGR
jgi:AcrR family transcriptional regulator